MTRTVLADRSGTATVRFEAADGDEVCLAAEELTSHLGEAAHDRNAGGDTSTAITIWLGSIAQRRFAHLEPPSHPQGFTVEVTDTDIAVVGSTAVGTLYGAYDLLEKAGVHWLAPGPHGTIIPPTLALAPSTWTDQPHFEHRVLQGVSPYLLGDGDVDPSQASLWYRRKRLGGQQFGAHGIPTLPLATAEHEPQLFIQEGRRATHQLDVTLPEVLDRVEAAMRAHLDDHPGTEVIHLGPEDGDGFGITDWDVLERLDPLLGTLVVTDRYVRFFNQLLDRLSDSHPDLRLAFYAHGACMEPPAREQPNPRLIPVIAPISAQIRRSLSGSGGNEDRYVMRVIDEWQALGLDWMYRGYLGALSDPGIPYSSSPEVATLLPAIAERGAGVGIRLECFGGWGHHGLAFNVAARLMWDPTAEVGGLQRDWLSASFGPAAQPMARYFERLHDAVASAPKADGGVFDLAASLELPVLAELERHLVRAGHAAAADPGATARLATVRQAFDFGSSFLEAYRQHLRGAYTEATASLELARERVRSAMTSTPAALWTKARESLDRTAGSSIDAVSRLVERYGPPMAVTPRTWQALIDDTGATARPGTHDGRWSSLDAWLTWAVQGLRHVDGAAWYRCTLPGRSMPGPPELIIPQLEAPCRAWLNGVPLKLVTDPLAPDLRRVARFDLSRAWQTDQSNQLLLQVVSEPSWTRPWGVLGTGMVFSDRSRRWTPSRPVAGRPGPEPELDTPTAPTPVPDREAVPVHGQWWALLDPHGVAERLGLYDEGLSLDRFRSFDPAVSPADQGLGRYGGGMVLRATLSIPRRARELLLHGDPSVEVWIDQQPCATESVEDTADSQTAQWVRVALPQSRSRSTGIVVSVPRSSHGWTGLRPHWVLDGSTGVVSGHDRAGRPRHQ